MTKEKSFKKIELSSRSDCRSTINKGKRLCDWFLSLAFSKKKKKTYARRKNKVVRGAFIIIIIFCLIQISFSVKDEEFMIRSKKKKIKLHVPHAFLCRTLRLFLLQAVLYRDNSNLQCQILHSLLLMLKPFKHFELTNASPMLHNNEIALLTNPLAAES